MGEGTQSICDVIRKWGSHFCDKSVTQRGGGSKIAQICVASFLNGPLA